ncbi:1-deoxy-D-xylulose-5-phosphate synthase [uncultured Clostridium sp.]|uniref:1-deoxy-D-xylulose-5-phosphate synthase n=1 Tax=uncultured Clostridium sp. TaxID=59620 RepID=UPI0026727312|nr:1-deoxy-D-xylulose-5-phosphate synthase [uncultured Clostridium sp.]
MSKLLDKISSPIDVHKFSNKELTILSNEIREFLIDNVLKTGGHLSSNLGVVELTLSLYKNFNLEKDKIVWDVGHQSYVHKMLSGRKNQFSTLRKYKGISGFPKISESEYDAFGTGHSSTSISAALGIARARDILKEDYNVVAVIGDGALTGGMALEAINDLGFNKSKMIIILNDNQMSISKNVGALSNHLNMLRVAPNYNKIKNEINQTLNTSVVGKSVANSIHKIKDSIKNLVVPSKMFEEMGLKYIGPIDGHDIELMNEVLTRAKQIDGPVLIHVITKKGKGYELAEENPNKYHGVSGINDNTEKNNDNPGIKYSKAFGDFVVAEAEKNEKLVCLTAAMPDGTGLNEFAKLYPNRFFDVGIAEEHATTLSAGMASAGLRPIFAVYSTFLQRAFDQIIHDVCIQNLPVIFAVDRAGIVGDDGETHQGVFDLSYLSLIPNMTVLAPKQVEELSVMMKWALKENRPIAIRYPREGDFYHKLTPLSEIKYGKWEKIIDGDKVAIISVGKMVQYAMLANEGLIKEGINPTIISASFIKPLDLEMLKELVENNYDIITVEDNVGNGGFGSYVIESLYNLGFKGKFKSLSYKDEFIPHGKVDLLYSEYGLDSVAIKNTVITMIK